MLVHLCSILMLASRSSIPVFVSICVDACTASVFVCISTQCLSKNYMFISISVSNDPSSTGAFVSR